MLLKTSTRTRGTWSRCTFAALLVLLVLAAPLAWAHTDPPGSDATGIQLSITAFRNDGVTPVLGSGGTVSQCETIQYRATLSWAGFNGVGNNNSAFEGGTWTITTPDGVSHDVTPGSGIPCIGGTIDDPNSAANGGRGLCDGAPTSINSALITYTVDLADVVGGSIPSSTALSGAFAHLGTGDLPGVGADTPFGLPVEVCDDGLFCNGVETCDPAGTNGPILGICVPGTPEQCADGFCFNEVCDEDLDECVRSNDNEGEVCGANDDACIPDVCEAGVCGEDNGTPVSCDEFDTFCLDVECTPATGECTTETPQQVGEVCGANDDACIPDVCTAEGICGEDNGTPVSCDGLDTFCLDVECTPATGECTTETPQNEGVVCDANDDACIPDVCEGGVCGEDNGTPVICDDEICEACDPATGECYLLPEEEAPDICYPDLAVCRTPGFWGTHAGDPKGNAVYNITETVLGDGMWICGTFLDDVDVGSTSSALEAMCVSPRGTQELQLVRQLTAAGLNCLLSGGDSDCFGIEIYDLFNACNATCDGTGGPPDGPTVQECIADLDCWNNGGAWVDGICQTNVGICDDEGMADCSDQVPCGEGIECIALDNCHNRSLCEEESPFCFEPPGPATSPKDCNMATKNDTYVIDVD